MARRRSQPAYTPSAEDVEYSRRILGAWERLNELIPKKLKRADFDYAGYLLGLHEEDSRIDTLSQGTLDVVIEAMVFQVLQDGTTLIERFAASHQRKRRDSPDELERVVLQAAVEARYAILRVDEILPGAGFRAWDLRTEEDIVVLAADLGDEPELVGQWIAGHLLAIGGWRVFAYRPVALGELPLKVLRRCLADLRGAVRHIEGVVDPDALGIMALGLQMESAAEALGETEPEDPGSAPGTSPPPLRLLESRPPSRNTPCPCGSGRKYKRCCGK